MVEAQANPQFDKPIEPRRVRMAANEAAPSSLPTGTGASLFVKHDGGSNGPMRNSA